MKKPIKAAVLFSGGLDSMLTVRILQTQGIQVEGLNFRTPFGCCTEPTKREAQDLGIEVTYLNLNDDYLRVIENPNFPYGRGVNPCVDCRVHMFQIGKRFLKEIGAQFIASGEVVGQRPNSQRKDCLKAIANESNLDDFLLRPLSAKILPPTYPERKGWVDREKLYSFSGRSRKDLLELGKKLGLKSFPSPSIGCLLTDPHYSKRVRDMWQYDSKTLSLNDYDILKMGRHFRVRDQIKIVVGKNENHNERLEKLARPGMVIYKGYNFKGPLILALSTPSPNALEDIQKILLKYSKNTPSSPKIASHNVGNNEERILTSSLASLSQEQLDEMRV